MDSGGLARLYEGRPPKLLYGRSEQIDRVFQRHSAEILETTDARMATWVDEDVRRHRKTVNSSCKLNAYQGGDLERKAQGMPSICGALH